jgi:hypothetical protein
MPISRLTGCPGTNRRGTGERPLTKSGIERERTDVINRIILLLALPACSPLPDHNIAEDRAEDLHQTGRMKLSRSATGWSVAGFAN